MSGWPKADNVTRTGFDAKVNITVPGTSSFVVLPGGAAAPTPAQVRAGQNAAGTTVADNLKGSIACAAAKTEYAAAVSGLAGSSTYDVYFVAENASLKLQPQPTRITVNTAASLPINISLPASVNHDTCYNATSTITVAGPPNEFIVEGSITVTMIAGEKIQYLPGTWVRSGGSMVGKIAAGDSYCFAKSPMMTMNTGDDQEGQLFTERSFFKVYPNPTTGIFTIELQDVPENTRIHMEGYGMHGEKAFSADLSGGQKHGFSLAQQPSGIYFIRVTAGTKVETVKIIKR